MRSRVRTGHNHVSVMGNEILNDFLGAVLNVHIAPVNPGVLGPEGSRQEVVSCLAHGLASRSLGFETVSVLDGLAQLEVEVLLHHQGAAEGDLIGARLDALQFHGQDCESTVGGVANKECKIDQVVRVGQLRNKFEVLGQIGRSILEGGDDKNALLVRNSVARRLDRVQVDRYDGGLIDIYRSMVVEDDWRLEVGIPCLLLAQRHLHR